MIVGAGRGRGGRGGDPADKAQGVGGPGGPSPSAAAAEGEGEDVPESIPRRGAEGRAVCVDETGVEAVEG